VRRAFLCGQDRYSGQSFEHRKVWVRNRLKELIELFAIDCLDYSVMSSHLHSLLHNDPKRAATWSNHEVVRRWKQVFAGRRGSKKKRVSEETIEALAAIPALVDKYRDRLCSISWFNRCLNEYIACRANAEDDCTGRFWEGRFKSIKLETKGAIVACGVYIALNPIRAGVATIPEECDFTALQDRIRMLQSGSCCSERPRLSSYAQLVSEELTDECFVKLVDEVGRIVKSGKGHISAELEPLLQRLEIRSTGLVRNSQGEGGLFRRVIGSVGTLRALAATRAKNWYHGVSSAKILFL